MPSVSLTKYTPSKGLFIGGEQVMTTDTVTRWSKQFNAPPKTLGGLKLKKPQEIIHGGSIGYRPENQSYAMVGRSTLFQGGSHGDTVTHPGSSVTLTEFHHEPIVHKPALVPSVSSSFRPAPTPSYSTVISTPSLSSVRRTPCYRSMDPYGMANYLDIRYEDLAREIERARFQRKLESLEEEYRKIPKKTTRRRKTPKRKTTNSRKKSKTKKKK